MRDLMQAVGHLLRETAADVVLPVFGQREAHPEEKTPGEWVTSADRAAEALLTPRLAALLPGSTVLGEEAVSAEPRSLDRLQSDGDIWLLDPLDGTANFAAGKAPFALMAALIHNGETVGSWILDPLTGRLATAERGGGAWIDDHRVQANQSPTDLSSISGAVLRRFLPPDMLAHIAQAETQFAALAPGSGSAGHDYPDIATGGRDFALYWRTLPWDHLPGTLFLTEAGGAVARLDRRPYTAQDHHRPGLLAARSQDTWDRVHQALIPTHYSQATT